MSSFLCGLRRRAKGEQSEKEENLDDIMKHISMKKWATNIGSEEVEGSIVRHLAMTLDKRRRATRGSKERTVVHCTHQAVPTKSVEMCRDDDLDMAFEDEFYVEEEGESML